MICLSFLTRRARVGEIRFLALTMVGFECCMGTDSTLFCLSHSCKGVLSWTDSSQRGFWQLLISQGSERYVNPSHQTPEKSRRSKESVWICANKSFLTPALFTKLIQGKASPLQPKQRSMMQRVPHICQCPCCDPAWALKHSQWKKWIMTIEESFLCLIVICPETPMKTLQTPSAASPNACASGPGLVTPLILCRRSKIKVGGTWFCCSCSQHRAWNLDSRWFAFLSHGAARSDTSALTPGFGMDYGLESASWRLPCPVEDGLHCSTLGSYTVKCCLAHGQQHLSAKGSDPYTIRNLVGWKVIYNCLLCYPRERGKRTENIKHLLEKTRPALYLIKTFCFVPFVIISIQWANILVMKMTVFFHRQTK